MNTIPTRRENVIVSRVRANYIRWRLQHVEQDVAHMKKQIAIHEGVAAELRVELAQMGERR